MTSEFRSKIRPYPHVAVYPTRWAGELTFQQIYDDLAHYASNVMKNFGVFEDELPDCLQIDFMALWETLVERQDFLAEEDRQADRVLHLGALQDFDDPLPGEPVRQSRRADQQGLAQYR